MSLLGKKDEKIPVPDPNKSKEKVIKQLLQNAVAENDWTIVDFVLNKCWNKDRVFMFTCDKCGSLLHAATKRNNPRVARVLIQHGINVNNRNNNGDTSLHIAARSGFSEIIDLLFESGCNPFIENQNGRQAFDEVVDDKVIKEKLRLYSVRCSRVKLMKNLETWKNIVSEEERKDELLKSRIRNKQQRRKTSVVVTPPILKRSDSGIISDLDSDKSSSRASINSTTASKTASNTGSTQSQAEKSSQKQTTEKDSSEKNQS